MALLPALLQSRLVWALFGQAMQSAPFSPSLPHTAHAVSLVLRSYEGELAEACAPRNNNIGWAADSRLLLRILRQTGAGRLMFHPCTLRL